MPLERAHQQEQAPLLRFVAQPTHEEVATLEEEHLVRCVAVGLLPVLRLLLVL